MKMTIEGSPREVCGFFREAGGQAGTAPQTTELVTACELAKILGIHPRRVQQLSSDGIFHRMQLVSGFASYDLAASVKSYCEHLNSQKHHEYAVEHDAICHARETREGPQS